MSCHIACMSLAFPLEGPLLIAVVKFLVLQTAGGWGEGEGGHHAVHSAVVPRECPPQIFLQVTSKLRETPKDPLTRIGEATCEGMISG